VPKLGRILHRPVTWLERRYARPLRVAAARGVILAAGGFAASRPMMRTHAPNARGGLPLATPGDDGSGIRLGTQAGGATAFLDRVSVWRFLSPPPALLAGVLVDRAGQRVCDESRYGAAVGGAILRHGGRAWLLVDHATRAQARRQVRGSTLWFLHDRVAGSCKRITQMHVQYRAVPERENSSLMKRDHPPEPTPW
jgi:3-oxo-5alpha-steroid 4-dehydrogenase